MDTLQFLVSVFLILLKCEGKKCYICLYNFIIIMSPFFNETRVMYCYFIISSTCLAKQCWLLRILRKQHHVQKFIIGYLGFRICIIAVATIATGKIWKTKKRLKFNKLQGNINCQTKMSHASLKPLNWRMVQRYSFECEQFD